MKQIIFLAALCFCTSGFAQGLTKTGEGESSFLFGGIKTTFDIAKTELSFGASNINNLKNTLTEFQINDSIKGKFVFGINLTAKNESNIGGLFSKGYLVPAANMSAFAGISFSKGLPYVQKQKALGYAKDIQQTKGELYDAVAKRSIEIIQTHTSFDTPFMNEIIKLHDTIGNTAFFLKKLNSETIPALEKDSKKNKEKLDALAKIKNELEILLYQFQVETDKYDRAQDELMAVYGDLNCIKKSNWTLTPYLFGGINASEFTRFVGTDTSNLKNSFQSQDFRGGHIGAGINYSFNQFYFGANYAYVQTSNFDLLTKAEYAWQSETISNNQKITESKTYKGYSGDYSIVEANKLRADFIWNVALNDGKNDNYMLLNLYANSTVFSRKTDFLPNSTNLGVGAYFFNSSNGKFMGGLYVELPDVENNYEKLKPVADQNTRHWMNRLSFGLVTTFTIGTMLDRF